MAKITYFGNKTSRRNDVSNMNLRVTVKEWQIAIDAGGGSTYSMHRSWTIWAEKSNVSGHIGNTESVEQWSYNTTFKIRYNSEFKSNMTIDEGSVRWLINSIEVDSESNKKFMIMRCSKTDIDINIS